MLILRFLRVDWHVTHGHRAIEIATVCAELARRPARDTEIVIEAGCWKGGSTAKLSLLCRLLGYHLMVFDSFAGVQPRTQLEGQGFDFTGAYSASIDELRANLKRYGEPHVVSVVDGWFEDTVSASVDRPVRLVFIDCDLAKGNQEVIESTLPWLVDDAVLFTHDFHIPAVRELLMSQSFWNKLGRKALVRPVVRNLGYVQPEPSPKFG